VLLFAVALIPLSAQKADASISFLIVENNVVLQGSNPGVLILINEELHPKIKEKLTVFEQDLNIEGYQAIEVTVSGQSSPPEIKDLIKSYYLKGNLKGAILVGNIKSAYYESDTGDFSNPNALKIWISLDAADHYYMDIDGSWEHATPDFFDNAPANIVERNKYPSCDTFKNEYVVYFDKEKKWDYGSITNKEQYRAEIWVSRIMPHNLNIPGKNEAQIINDFFDCDHKYRTGEQKVSDKAYILNAIGPGYNEQGMDYTEIFSSVIKMTDVTKTDFINCLEDPAGSQLIYLTAHSWPQGHSLYDTSFTTDELANKKKNSRFYLLNTCSACRWDQYVSSPENPNYLGGLYVFDKTEENGDYGLGAIGFTGIGGFNNLKYFTDYLNDDPNGTYGEAYQYWFNKNLMINFSPSNYVYLGDPIIGPVRTPPELTLFTPEIGELNVTINGVATPYSNFEITRIGWNWGDGALENSWFPALHTYSSAGNYTILVTAYQSNEQTTTKAITIEIKGPPPPPSSSGIPGFPIESILLGIAISIAALMIHKGRRTNPRRNIAMTT